MKVYVNAGLSLTFLLTLTSFQKAWSGTPIFQLTNQVQDAFEREDNHPLVRRARNIPRRLPCVFMSQLKDIKTRFEQWMDQNKDGRADFQEVKAFLKKLKADVTNDIVLSFIRRRDENGNGEVDLIPEYIKEIVENDYGIEAATEWFYLHDVNSDGFVSKSELVRLGMAVGMNQAQAEDTAVGYYLPLDSDGDGKLNFSEFSRLYQDPSNPTA